MCKKTSTSRPEKTQKLRGMKGWGKRSMGARGTGTAVLSRRVEKGFCEGKIASLGGGVVGGW